MCIIGRFGLFRRRSTVPGFAAQDVEELRIGAAMAHVQEWGNLDGFPTTRSERLALMTTAMRRGLVAWDRSSDCYSLSARGQRYLKLHAPRPAGRRPRAAGHSPRRKWARRLRAASVAALACLGLVALDPSGAWRVTSYFAAPMLTAIKGPTGAPSAAPAEEARTHAVVAALSAPPEQSLDGSQPMSRQTAMAQSAEPSTGETSAAATPQPPALAREGEAHRRHHAKSSRSARSHRGLEPPHALGFAEADPYRQYRGWNSFGRSAGFGFFH